MKYDASMTEFHGDIVAAVRLMCGKDTDARSNSEGASPAPLRDYLKNQYSNSGRGDDGFMYLCYPSKGMEIKLDREIDNSGDMSITLSWSQVAKFIRDNPSEIFGEEDKPAEPPAPAPAQTETAVVFDYSELDTDTAAKLETLTAEIFNVRKEYIFTMAKKVAYAHDLLANYGNGKFGAWCESIGITRQTGNNLIQIVKLFDNSSEIERQNLEKLTDGNVKLLYEAARPSAPAELVEAVKNGDITTHKEYIELKKQLEEAESRAEAAERNVDKLHESNQKMRTENIAALVRADKAEKQLKELESRPVEVAVEQDTAAIAERDERIAELEEQLRSRDSELDFGNNNASCDKMSEFYEMLHGKALNALKDCMAFIRSDGLPQIVKNRAVGRFGTLKDLIEMYIDELEEI